MDELNERAERLVDSFPYMMKVFHRIGTRVIRYPDITAPQFHTLSALSNRPQWTLADLAIVLGIKSPAASEIVDRLVKVGWIVRTINPNDRRQTILKLSGKGKTFMKRLRASMIQSYADILSLMTPRQQTVFENSIRNLVNIATDLEKREHKK